ncbi:MAG: hypothetical protein HC929_00640 [Leptolyngbyaceae cyanobacterium SM2_5_2]|nr:hypothetical protein [Leptolyngbyaceae cyanobacterium SM2_5_2]
MSDSHQLPPDSSSSGGPAKWILATGCIGCLVLPLLLMAALALLVSRNTRFGVGPETVQTDGNALFTYTLPESQGIFDMALFGMEVTQVAGPGSPPSVLLTMGKLPNYLQNPADQKSLVESFRDNMTVEGSYQLNEQRTEDRTLCDQPVSVLIQSGSFQDGQTAYNATSLLTLVAYNNTTRFAWILAHGDTAQENADQVFSSLDCQ